MKRLWSLCAVTGTLLVAVLPAYADTIGQAQVFRVNSAYDIDGASTIGTTLRAVGEHTYLYLDDRAWALLAPSQQVRFQDALQQFVQQFDTVTYPRTTAFWGREANPGVDKDPHIAILLERLIAGNGGYVDTINNYPHEQAPNGNAREMVSLNADSILEGGATSFAAHEFQHLISFNQKEILRQATDDVWLNEARSEYNITVAGFSTPFSGSTLQRRTQSFMRSPSDSLVDWPNTATDYAIASVFVHYLADRYGADMVASTIRTGAAGIEAIDQWLTTNGKTERFGDIFTDWMLAVYVNDRSIDSRYGYSTEGLNQIHVPATQMQQLSADARSLTNLSVQEWEPSWIDMEIPAGVTPLEYLRMDIVGQQSAPWYGEILATYTEGVRRVIPWTAARGSVTLAIPTTQGGQRLLSAVLAITQGLSSSVQHRTVLTLPVSITTAFSRDASPIVTATPVPQDIRPGDGDLIRRTAQQEAYVIWGHYRRYLTQDALRLYGFQDRAVAEASEGTFGRYVTSNYIRALGQKKVYAVWPDGTKHWLNITTTQWDTSGRDWGAIFTVNDAEVAAYRTGSDITR